MLTYKLVLQYYYYYYYYYIYNSNYYYYYYSHSHCLVSSVATKYSWNFSLVFFDPNVCDLKICRVAIDSRLKATIGVRIRFSEGELKQFVKLLRLNIPLTRYE